MGIMMALVHCGGGKLKTVTFNESGTFTAPPGVFNVAMSGKGGDGVPSYIQNGSRNVVSVTFRTDASTGTGNANWDSVNLIVSNVINQLNNGNSSSFDSYAFQVWPDGTNSYQTTDNFIGNFIRGSVTQYTNGGWKTSGAIQESGSSGINYQSQIAAAAGADATAIGRTFPGGQPGLPALLTVFDATAVAPGQSYAVTVPSGGSITIGYYE